MSIAKAAASAARGALSWSSLQSHAAALFTPADTTVGPTNAQSRLRLFGKPESEVRVTLYRDNHGLRCLDALTPAHVCIRGHVITLM